MSGADRKGNAGLAADAIFLEVFWTRVRSIADEAAKLIVRTSFSTLSSEANDFAVVVTDSRGRALAENSGSIPSFIATLPRTVRAAIAQLGVEQMRPGDIYITNNPWIGTGHLNDVCLVKPIFHEDKLVGFSASAGHVPDIGGKIRSVDARELYEEGFHIPLMHLLREGKADETLLALIRTNVRTPEQTVGDIWSQVGAVELIARRLAEVLAEYALDGMDDLAQALFDRGEAAMRQAISAIADGVYRYEMQTDGFGEMFRFAVAVRVQGSDIVCDFDGTSAQQPRAINCVLAYTYAMTAYAIKCLLLPELPNNDGLFRPISVLAPEGSILNPKAPAPVGGRACTGHYVPIAIFGALYAVLPERVMAGAGSPLWIRSQPCCSTTAAWAPPRTRTAPPRCRGRAIFRLRRSRWPSAMRRCSCATSACARNRAGAGDTAAGWARRSASSAAITRRCRLCFSPSGFVCPRPVSAEANPAPAARC
jgi:N-methylhydantoinase B